MILLYLRYRLRMLLNYFTRGSKKDWGAVLLPIFVILVNIPFLVGVLFALNQGFKQIAVHYGEETLHRLLYPQIGLVGFLLLLSALKAFYPALFEASDLDFLKAMPIKRTEVYGARFVLQFMALTLVMLLLLPAAVIYGLTLEAHWTYYLTLPLTFLFFALLIVGLSSVVMLLLARLAAGRKWRMIIKYGPTVLMLPLLVGTMVAIPYLQHKTRDNEIAEMLPAALSFSHYLAYGPSAWLGDALAAAAAGRPSPFAMNAGLLVGGATLLLWLAIRIGRPLFELDAVSVQSDGPQKRGSVKKTELQAGMGWLSPSSRALWRLELSAVRQEAVRTVVPGLGISVVFLFMAVYLDNPGFGAMPGIFMVSMCVGLCTPAVGQEGRAFWILRSLPVPMWKILALKFLVRTSLALGAVVLLGAAIILLLPLVRTTFVEDPLLGYGGALIVLLTVPVCAAWSLLIGARFPRFEPATKGQYMGFFTGVCATLGTFLIVGSMVLSFVPLKVEALYGVEVLRPLLFFLPGIAFVFWVGVCALLAVWALWNLKRLEI